MEIILSRIVLGTHEIPVRIRKLIRDEGLQYDAESLEELRMQHAAALLRGVSDSAANALSYALGMKNLSKDELQKIADGSELQPPPTTSPGWDLQRQDQGFSGNDVLYGDALASNGDIFPIVVSNGNEWQFGFFDTDSGDFMGDPDGNGMYNSVPVGDRDAVRDLFIKHGVKPPSESDFASIE